MSRSNRFGWLLFLASSLLFGVAGMRSGDWLIVVGSAVFGVACVVFLLADR